MIDPDDFEDLENDICTGELFPGRIDPPLSLQCNSCIGTQPHVTLKHMRKKRAEQQGVYDIKIKNDSKVKQRWLRLSRKCKTQGDPWKDEQVVHCQVEAVDRYRYDSKRERWTADEVFVRIESTSFAHGALRNCYRLKKLFQNSENSTWDHSSCNYVAKNFIQEDLDDSQLYRSDVILQMKAKIWAAAYNSQKAVKKKVDIMQMCYIKFKNRSDQPEFHLERFVDGEYIKYNSNSGFVDSTAEHCRNTPQAFSHFTFEWSQHQLIVVDIQGVGDVYTDPQIHTIDGAEYGDGNLGPRGMALFFHSHRCNSICKALDLSPFDLSPSELRALQRQSSSCLSIRSSLTEARVLPKGSHKHRAISESNGFMDQSDNDIFSSSFSNDMQLSKDSGCWNFSSNGSRNSFQTSPLALSSASLEPKRIGRIPSQGSDFPEYDSGEEVLDHFLSHYGRRHRPSCIKELSGLGEVCQEESLGEIHFELAELHHDGRFLENKIEEEIDRETIFYHLKRAADVYHIRANVILSQIHFGMLNDFLPPREVGLEAEHLSIEDGLIHLCRAADLGDPNSIVRYAGVLDGTDDLLSLIRKYLPNYALDWFAAVHYYRKWFDLEDVNQLDVESMPDYYVYSKLAFIWGHGGYGLEADCEKAYDYYTAAGDAATEAGKGKLALKYYEQAECAA